MSQHPSLRSSYKGRQHRSVLKRYEKLKILKDKEKWDAKDSVFGLAKVKVVKFKVKKEKAVVEGAEATIAGGALPPADPGPPGGVLSGNGGAVGTKGVTGPVNGDIGLFQGP